MVDFDYLGYFGTGGSNRQQPQQQNINNFGNMGRMTTGTAMYNKPYKTTFVSKISLQDAQQKCLQAGYTPVGQLRNKHGQFVVFGRLQQRSVSYR